MLVFNDSLLSSMVDRWRPETHTFHLPCGKMTITLQDVNLITGLPVTGEAITGITDTGEWKARVECRLGVKHDTFPPDWKKKRARKKATLSGELDDTEDDVSKESKNKM
jgi:hypothetical protein